MNRRTLLVAPAAVLIASAPLAQAYAVSELRYAATSPGADIRARALARCLGIPVRAVRLPPADLAAALNAGHLEFAELEPTATRRARALMGSRLIETPVGLLRRALPDALRADLIRALARTA